jgi:hypothetical protein
VRSLAGEIRNRDLDFFGCELPQQPGERGYLRQPRGTGSDPMRGRD